MPFQFNLIRKFKARFGHRPKARTVIIAVLVLLFGGLFLFNVAKGIMIKKFFTGFKPPAATISVAKAELQKWRPSLQTVGSLRAVRGVDLAAEVAGTVSKIYVKAGEEAAEGQPLVDLDDRIELQSLANFQSQLDLTQAMFSRQEMLIKEHAISKQDFDQASANLKQAQANVNKEQQLIAQKHIVAPFSGRLGILQVSIGQYLTPGTSLVSLQAMDPLYLDFSVTEQHLSDLKLGQKVNLQLDAYPGQSFTGDLSAINSKINADTRNIDLQATVPNKDEKLLPGLFGHVEIVLDKPAEVVTVPATAITSTLYGDSIYVVEKIKADESKPAEYIVHERVVTVGETRAKRIAILKGIKPGEVVVSSGQLKLHDGAEVNIDNKVEL